MSLLQICFICCFKNSVSESSHDYQESVGILCYLGGDVQPYSLHPLATTFSIGTLVSR
jgi:hypothetical protein